MKHSTIVGGSTAARVIACPGSVALCAKMPPKPETEYSRRGTLLHSAMATILGEDVEPRSVIGMTYKDQTLTEELFDEKIVPALAAIDVIDPDHSMEYAVEQTVSFGKYIPDAFGSADLLGKRARRGAMIDFKFGDGIPVSAEENEQLMYYTAAAKRTPEAAWAFEDIDDIECVIIQPPAEPKRWVTTLKRIRSFELQLKRAVKASAQPDAPFKVGPHCKFCSGKPVCPLMTGAVDRALVTQIAGLDKEMIGKYLGNADILETWISDLRALAMQVMEAGTPVPGYKLVAKRGTRKWTDEIMAVAALKHLGVDPYKEPEVRSPAQAEKLLKPLKKALPEDLIATVSSGNTFAPESDPRPAIVQIGQQLTAALSKIV